ncbi:MAG: cation diffusion facilitator family transporter [Lentisphaeria bacterium]|jgi:cation diffusion facilitator family transporter
MLSSFLIKVFVPNPKQPDDPSCRLAYGMLCGLVTLVINLLLFGLKLVIGIISGSIAIAADAINNLSDAGSAMITVVGFKLAAKHADAEHPFGHGRMEYVAGLLIAVIIVAVGGNFLKESIVRIIRPQPVEMPHSLAYLYGATVLVKLWLMFFTRRVSRAIQSAALGAVAFDCLSDILTTGIVLISVAVARYSTLPIDGCAGTVVAIIVIAGGINSLRNIINPLLGERPDPALVDELRRRLLACPGIHGIHDVIVHNYGPGTYFATAHAEVDRDGDLVTMHNILEAAELEIARTMPVRVILHCDPYATADPQTRLWRQRCEDAVHDIDRHLVIYDLSLEPAGDVTSGSTAVTVNASDSTAAPSDAASAGTGSATFPTAAGSTAAANSGGTAATADVSNAASISAAADSTVSVPAGTPILHFHLLIPRNYPLSQDAIRTKVTRALQKYDPKLHVHIDFMSSFV